MLKNHDKYTNYELPYFYASLVLICYGKIT
jgi:hypothetical protein